MRRFGFRKLEEWVGYAYTDARLATVMREKKLALARIAVIELDSLIFTNACTTALFSFGYATVFGTHAKMIGNALQVPPNPKHRNTY